MAQRGLPAGLSNADALDMMIGIARRALDSGKVSGRGLAGQAEGR
jgi:hypothetical protein